LNSLLFRPKKRHFRKKWPKMKKNYFVNWSENFCMCMRCHWHCMHNKIFELRKAKIMCKTAMLCKKNKKNACGVNYTAHTVHALSLTPHGDYDTACTIDERFERPWQPLKVISIKNIYVPELLSYPTPKNIFKFKGAT
jgi:hypothetical protein